MNARLLRRIAAGLFGIAVLTIALVAWLNLRGDPPLDSEPLAGVHATPQLLQRGAYLARAGNCASCHTVRGGPPYAGGRGIETPFGTVYAGNLTPDRPTGIGNWSSGDFWRAMHNGRSRDGSLLYPAFPYPNFTQVTREDSDAIFAFLRTQTPVEQANRAHQLRFPYDTQAALAVWRALFFRAQVFKREPGKTAEWNRGAYLVRGLGHCVACHSTRNALGATSGALELGGGVIPLQNWYAPSLASADEAGVAQWQTDEVVRLLKTGSSPRGAVLGPMAEVVFRSTQHLDDADLRSIAVFLQQLPQAAPAAREPLAADAAAMGRGAKIYEDRCASCHGDQGQGAANAYPALAGSRKVAMGSPANVVRVIVEGGFAPTTSGNPRPFGMPPFGQALSNAAVADVATYVRNAWGNRAAPVSELDVIHSR
jgi:mono/diheme cytochrome c family protein